MGTDFVNPCSCPTGWPPCSTCTDGPYFCPNCESRIGTEEIRTEEVSSMAVEIWKLMEAMKQDDLHEFVYVSQEYRNVINKNKAEYFIETSGWDWVELHFRFKNHTFALVGLPNITPRNIEATWNFLQVIGGNND